MDVEMARAMGQIEGRLGAVEARVAHNEVSTAASLATLENSTSGALQRLEDKIDTLFDKLTRGAEHRAYADGNSKGAKAMAIFIVTVAASLGGILFELGKITWAALTGHHH